MQSFLVTTSAALEDLLCQEIQSLCPHLTLKTHPGQVAFDGELKDAYRICLWSRLANRVLLKLNEGDCKTPDDLYAIASGVDWAEHFSPKRTFVIDFWGSSDAIRNTQFGALKVKDAIADQFMQSMGIRPSVDKVKPDLRIQARLHRGVARVYLDLTGKSLHMRFYRQKAGAAPLKEHLAFAMLMRSGWTQNMDKPLLDPMCGSGTLVIEAAQYAANMAPALERRFWGFSMWKGHSKALWTAMVYEAEQQIKPIDTPFFASDLDSRMLGIAKQNADAAGVLSAIVFVNEAAQQLPAPDCEPGYIVTNPPYGERLNELTELLPVFRAWGLQLKTHFKGWQLSVLSADRDLLKQLKLRGHKEYKLINGNLPCVLINYRLDDDNCEVHESSLVSDFANRLGKNLKKLKKWLKQADTQCYRVYDADLPDYNGAVDVYGDWVVLQEYAPPKTIPPEKARARLQQMLMDIPVVMGISADKLVLKTRQQQKGKSQYERMEKRNETMVVEEQGARFLVNLHDYLDTGLFLDHRITRRMVRDMSRNKKVLNLFAYTGSVSVYAAMGGATSVTTVDMSRTYLDWAKRNFELNHLHGYYDFVQSDVLSWLEGCSRQYDLIFVDPPSFSNSKRMDTTWDVQRDHLAMLALVKKVLAPGGKVIFSNNLRQFKLDRTGVESLGLSVQDITNDTIPEDFKRNSKIHHCWLFTDVD